MGWYLAEGSITLKSKNYWQIKISQENEKYVQEILILCKRLFERFSFKVHRWKGGVFVCGNDREFYEYFKSLGHSYEKYIPWEIKNLHVSALRRLLDAFNKGDGSCYDLRKINSQKGGKWQANFAPLKIYATSSKKLADDLTEVILKCGKLPSLYPPEKPGKSVKFANGTYLIKHPTWVVAELNSKNFYVRKKDRAVKEGQKRNFFTVDYEWMVYCVELERNHILYVRRNGRCTWSGNCRSTVRAVFKGSSEAKTARKRKPENIPPIPEGFEGSPLDNWWKLTDSMAKRAVNYRIHGEILEKAKRLCRNNFADECPEWEEVKELIEKWKLQQEIEERFSKRLESFEWNSRKQIKANFPKLWETEEKYRWHVNKRIEKGHVLSEDEYIEKIFEALSEHTSVIIYEAPKWKNESLWHRIFYSRKCKWVVILGETGNILTAFKIEPERFQVSLETFKRQGYKAFRGVVSEKVKETCRRILFLVKSK